MILPPNIPLPEPSIPPSNPLESRLEPTCESRLEPNLPLPQPTSTQAPPNPRLEPTLPLLQPTSTPTQPQALGFLPADQWQSIQNFNKAMAAVEMETYSRCKEHWFLMDLKDGVCHRCFNRDKGNKTPFLMSADNKMDPGEIPAYLPELTQIEEMIIA